MTAPYKPRLVQRIIEAVRVRMADPSLDRARAETALRKLGMSPGNAQRLMDESTDVRIGTLIDAAARLGTPSGALLSIGVSSSTNKPSLSVDPTALTLAQALPVVLDALAGIPAMRWPGVQAMLAQAVGHPEMRDDLAAELLPLLRPATADNAAPAKRSNAA